MTEQDLAKLEEIVSKRLHPCVDISAVAPLLAEVRRLLSAEWLQDAATNVADETHRVVGGTLYADDIFRILRKHRDANRSGPSAAPPAKQKTGPGPRSLEPSRK